MRSIKQISPAVMVQMGDVYVDQPLPYGAMDQIDPFLLIHHWKNRFTGNQQQKEVGVGPHPHRGFSPVTFIYKGSVHHRDSRGNDSIVDEGGTQWMNSGMGIIHSERPTAELAENGGEFEIIQFWVNNPSTNKMDQPTYHPLQERETPFFYTEDGLSKVYVVSGEMKETTGKMKGNSPLLILRMNIARDSEFTLDVPADYNALIYLLNGRLNISENEIFLKSMIVFENDDNSITIKGLEDSRAILLAGQPIGEKVESYGPFVMNNQTEIMEAIRDYQKGKMGILIEEFRSDETAGRMSDHN